MLQFSAKSFAELAQPLSVAKVFLLVEIADADRAGQMDCFPLLLRGLGLKDTVYDSIEYAEQGYLVAEAGISDRSRDYALAVVDYFRQGKLRDIAQVYLFIDGQLVEHSGDGRSSVYDLAADLPATCCFFRPP